MTEKSSDTLKPGLVVSTEQGGTRGSDSEAEFRNWYILKNSARGRISALTSCYIGFVLRVVRYTSVILSRYL